MGEDEVERKLIEEINKLVPENLGIFVVVVEKKDEDHAIYHRAYDAEEGALTAILGAVEHFKTELVIGDILDGGESDE